MTRVAILGGGSWGTALAIVLVAQLRDPMRFLCGRTTRTLAEAMRRDRENRAYLPGIALPEQVRITHEIGEALARRDNHCGRDAIGSRARGLLGGGGSTFLRARSSSAPRKGSNRRRTSA